MTTICSVDSTEVTMDANIYLHHYPASLFSEKIRLMLGYLEVPWHSVEVLSLIHI